MYKLAPQNSEGVSQVVQRLADNTFIPFAADNTDYQKYLKWLAEGNEPLPADTSE